MSSQAKLNELNAAEAPDDFDDDEEDEDYDPSKDPEAKGDDIPSDENNEVDEDPEDQEQVDDLFTRTSRRRRKNQSPKKNMKSELNLTLTKDGLTEEEKKKKGEQIWNEFKSEVDKSKNDDSDKLCNNQDKLTVTKVYDFAGEAVTVTEEIDGNTNAALASNTVNQTSKTTQQGLRLMPGVKRSGGLSSLVANLGKKAKMSTLQKSKLDWNNYKEEEGIKDELDQHNKSRHGYVEKQAFLMRSDLREFEREKDIRNKTRSNNT